MKYVYQKETWFLFGDLELFFEYKIYIPETIKDLHQIENEGTEQHSINIHAVEEGVHGVIKEDYALLQNWTHEFGADFKNHNVFNFRAVVKLVSLQTHLQER